MGHCPTPLSELKTLDKKLAGESSGERVVPIPQSEPGLALARADHVSLPTSTVAHPSEGTIEKLNRHAVKLLAVWGLKGGVAGAKSFEKKCNVQSRSPRG